MYQQGPPRADSGGMPPAGFGAQYPPTGQHPAYASTYQGSNVQAPQAAHQANMGHTYPGPRYSPPPQPAMSRPMSQYIADTRPSRMSMSNAPHSERPGDTPKTHYGDLVSEANEGATTACSGDAWGACCKYNALACLLCCNGCLRLCGGGMSLMEVLHLN